MWLYDKNMVYIISCLHRFDADGTRPVGTRFHWWSF